MITKAFLEAVKNTARYLKPSNKKFFLEYGLRRFIQDRSSAVLPEHRLKYKDRLLNLISEGYDPNDAASILFKEYKDKS